MTYNISHYVKEYIDWTFNDLAFNTTNDNPPDSEWCYVKVIRKYKDSLGVYEEIDTKTYIAFDGYGYYEDGYNPELGIYGLIDGATYNYHYEAGYSGLYLERYGDLRVIPTLDYEFRWTDLDTAATNTYTISAADISSKPVFLTFGVYPSYAANGNKLEYLTDLGVVLFTVYFEPIEECKYTPVVVDFVNKFGAWQRTFFYKVSKRSIKTTQDSHNLYKRDLVNYDVDVPQRRQFNVNGIESILLNTGWVDESYNENVLKQLMLSEQIRIDREPAKMVTQQTELFENINRKMINYALTFEYTFDTINSVI